MRPLVVMAENARNFSRGDFSKRIRVESKDEIGTLGDALNFMARGLSEQFQMQQNRQLILEQLGSTIELNALLSNAFGKICSTMGFQVGAVFLVDAEGKRLVRQALYCPGEEMLTQREELKMEEGLEGLAVTTLQPQILKDILPDTAYAVNWLGGNIKPAAIVAVPLVFNGQAIGVVSLAALQPITDQQLAELSDLCSLAGVAINNALSHRRAVELSHRLQRMNEQLVHQNEVLNAQSEELKAQSIELQAYAEEMRAQTEELQATSHELQLKNEELLRLGRQKSKFMAALSHELRAPLNAVIGFSDVLLDKVVGDLNSNQEKYLQEINVSGQHLLNLIDDLLDLTKLEIAEMELHFAAVDPADSLEKALAMVQADVQTKQLQVTNQLCQHRYTVWADRDKLRQVFLNLLTNAVKFTPSGGKITISAAGQNNMLAISVADTGIGIAQQDQEVIFDEFRQVGAISKEYGGTGLGLAIAKNLVQLHGGSIGVTSEEGQGAVFTFTLPMVSDDVRYLKKPADRDVLLAELAKANGGKSATDTTVLVIDDDYSVRDYLATVLKKEGYRVIMADTGQQGIELAIGSNPDIIILDVVMPQVDGFAVMGALNKSGCRPKVIIYTSQSLTLAEKQRLER
ncbi:ATP-binding protein [Peptococcaceae bacterium 1198_IL3148]